MVNQPARFEIIKPFEHSLFENINVMGWQNLLKFIGKTNRLTKMLIFTILASFMCFFNFSDRNPIISITCKLPFHVR